MDWAIEGFKRLASTTSTKEKEAILKEYKDLKADCFEELLKANLNPYKLYYITKLPEIPKLEGEPSCPVLAYYDFLNLIDILSTRKVTGNAAKDKVVDFFKDLDDECREIFSKVLLKQSIGVGVKTVNKVYGKGFIPEFKVMLAPSKNADIMHLEYPIMLQPKLDGTRAIYIPDNNEVNLWSRTGRPFKNINLKNYFNSLSRNGEYVLDGELYHHNIPFKQLMSVLGSEDVKIPNGLKFVVYDCIPLEDWHAQECKLDYDTRLRKLREVVTGQIADFTKIIDIKNDEVNSSSEIKDLYKKYLLDNYEGIMVKSSRGKYQWKRVTEKSGIMLKLKPFKSDDLEIVDFYEGEGKYKGSLGGLVVDIGNGNSCSVGSGFTDADRQKIWANKSRYLGKTVEVSYFEKTEESLRFPIFKRFRPDKD